MKFTYSVEIFEVIPEEKKRVLETLTGIVEADAKTAVPKCVWSGVRARVEQLGRETGMMISHGSLHVERASDSLASLTFLNTLKNQIRAVTKALDTRETEVFGQSLEAKSVKHEVSILLSELKVHGLLEDVEEMTPSEYQRCALRTLYPDLDYKGRLGLCGLGLPGEIGEVVDLIKKFLYHRNGKPLNVEKLKDELGDVLWYFFVLLDTVDLTFEEVMQANALKLQERHPNGFNPHYVSDSHASE